MNEVCEQCDDKMSRILDGLKIEYTSIRAGRANPAILNKVVVNYYGTATPINQIAAISVAEARVLVIQPWDKSLLKDIEKAILTSDIGINPSNDGNIIRIVFPSLTEDRRKEICKTIHKFAENTKISVRSVRRDGMEKIKTMKKGNEITDDESKAYEKGVQELTDKYCKEIDIVCEKKENEIMEI